MIIVLAEDYPNKKNKYAMSYIHTRNLYYKAKNLSIKVLCFRTKKRYTYEGIEVITESDYLTKYDNTQFKLVISHAPNLKNHIRFLKKHSKNFRKIMMVFHGHEVLDVSRYYPEPYDFIRQRKIKRLVRKTYDKIKLQIIKSCVNKLIKQQKIELLFVSEWMKKEFIKNVKISYEDINEVSHIIPNSSNPVFLNQTYSFDELNLSADFITIRPFDEAKYGIDIVRELAINNPDKTFHVYGDGVYFEHYGIPPNLTVINKFFTHDELPTLLNKYRVALMPTRLDAQGVMMCEMATFGIPVITSDISICREMIGEFDNTFFIDNKSYMTNLSSIVDKVKTKPQKNLKFSNENTVQREVDLILSIMGDNK